MFLVDAVAQFGSREINVKAYTRIINGKAVPVKGGRRTVLAIRDALNDLRKITRDNNEGAYLMNPRTGKVGQYVQGGKTSVQANANIFTGLQKRSTNRTAQQSDILSKIAQKQYTLHNHPNRTSLSGADLFNPADTSMVFNINTTGSIFRAKTNWGTKLPNTNLKLSDINSEILKKRSDDLLFSLYDGFRNGGAKGTEIDILGSHAKNLIIKNQGLIAYRAQLSDMDKNIIDRYKGVQDKLLQKYKNYDFSADIKNIDGSTFKSTFVKDRDVSNYEKLKDVLFVDDDVVTEHASRLVMSDKGVGDYSYKLSRKHQKQYALYQPYVDNMRKYINDNDIDPYDKSLYAISQDFKNANLLTKTNQELKSMKMVDEVQNADFLKRDLLYDLLNPKMKNPPMDSLYENIMNNTRENFIAEERFPLDKINKLFAENNLPLDPPSNYGFTDKLKLNSAKNRLLEENVTPEEYTSYLQTIRERELRKQERAIMFDEAQQLLQDPYTYISKKYKRK